MARALGATVIGTAGTDEGLKTVLANGAHVALNHRESGYTDKLKVTANYSLSYSRLKIVQSFSYE